MTTRTVFMVPVLALAACSTSRNPEPSPNDDLAPATSQELAGTVWQLVEFVGGDGTVTTPDDGRKYTMEFGTDGRVFLRIDCNRGSGTWESEGRADLRFGPLAVTRALCPAGSMHDRIVRDMEYVRSYVIEDGHLFLSLMADGGIYEYEPASAVDQFPGT